jgi:very-short-patch-repair endonuclease
MALFTNTTERQKHDSTRDKYLTSSGFNIIRFRNDEVSKQTLKMF